VVQPPRPGRRIRRGGDASGEGGHERAARPAARRLGRRPAVAGRPHGDRLGERRQSGPYRLTRSRQGRRQERRLVGRGRAGRRPWPQRPG
jgi:hypothetical protein